MKTKKNRRSVQRTNLSIENMEARQLFAADLIGASEFAVIGKAQLAESIQLFAQPTIELSSGKISVEATNFNDVITIEEITPLQNVSFNNPFGGSSFGKGSLGTIPLAPQIRVTVANEAGDVLQQESFDAADVQRLDVKGLAGSDTIRNRTALPATIDGGSGDDDLFGGSGIDTINGKDGDDRIYGNEGADIINGGNGDDYIYAGEGNDRARGWSGNDHIYGSEGDDNLRGDDGNDVLVSHNGNDYLYGGNDNDVLNGGSGEDYMDGGYGEDTMYGGADNDRMYGGNNDDVMFGESGNDTMYGQNGNDEMDGGSNDDTMNGGSGNDEMNGGSGRDTMDGSTGNDVMSGGASNDTMNGSDGNDTMRGDSGNDTISGGRHNDNLYGGSGNDNLHGNSGDDGLYGGAGTDRLEGDSGDDRFLVLNDVETTFLGLWSTGWTTSDTIVDKSSRDAKVNFQHGEGKTFDFGELGTSVMDDGEFTHAEIEEVDESLAMLHHQIGNTKLLKTAGGGEVTFERLGPQLGGDFSLGGVNSGGSKITLVDGSFDPGSDWLHQVVFHEIAHNWDGENADWDEWKDISGWEKDSWWPWQDTTGKDLSGDKDWYHDSSATFARDYGKTNPYEDFATYFAKVMMDDNGLSFGGSGASNAAKEAFMDDFFASLA